MENNWFEKGTIVRHIRLGTEYKVISSNSRMKLPSGEWVDAVVYAPLYSNEYEMFTREKESFVSNFTLCDAK